MADLGEGAPLCFGEKKKKSQKEEKLAGQAKQNAPPPPPLSSKSGSAMDMNNKPVGIRNNKDNFVILH